MNWRHMEKKTGYSYKYNVAEKLFSTSVGSSKYQCPSVNLLLYCCKLIFCLPFCVVGEITSSKTLTPIFSFFFCEGSSTS